MSPYSAMQLAEAFIRTGELADALEALNSHLEAQPHDKDALRLRASVLMRLPGEDYARAALADLEALGDKSADDYVQQSVIWQLGLGDWAQAVKATEQAHNLAPDDERITERLLMLYEQVGEIDRAQKLIATLPESWRWLQLAGDLALRTNQAETAIDHYNKALILLEDKMDTIGNPIARNIAGMIVCSRANAYLKASQFANAEADYRAAAEAFPKDLSYALMAGVTLALQGQIDEAVSLCKSVLQDEPSLMELLREKAAAHPTLKVLVERLGM